MFFLGGAPIPKRIDVGSRLKEVRSDVGDSVEIDCGRSDGKWYHINKHTGEEHDIKDEDEDDSVLTIPNVSEDDEGIYICQYLDHSVGIVKDMLRLEVRAGRARKIFSPFF